MILNAGSSYPLRILMLIDYLNIGGTETHVLSLVKSLISKGIYVVIVTSGGPLERTFEINGIKVIKTPIKTDNFSNRYALESLDKVKEIIDMEKINLIHCHLLGSMSIGDQIYRKYNIPYIVTLHGLFYSKAILYNTCVNASNIIAVSHPVKKMVCNKLGDRVKNKVIVIPNGVNIEEQLTNHRQNSIRKKLNINIDKLVIMYCSRLSQNKGIVAINFIDACFKLGQQYKNLQAITVGDGPYVNMIKEKAEILNKKIGRDLIYVEDASLNILQYYLESDIVVGTGRVALEAMSCSKPVIAIGDKGYVGIICEDTKELQWKTYFGDHYSIEKLDVLKLEKVIKFLLDNPKERDKIGAWSKKWCTEMFNQDLATNKTIELYRKTLMS